MTNHEDPPRHAVLRAGVGLGGRGRGGHRAQPCPGPSGPPGLGADHRHPRPRAARAGRGSPPSTASRSGVLATRGAATRARLNLSWPMGFAAAARRLIERGGCDVVHCHELRTVETVVAARIAVRVGVPVVLSPHGTLPYATGRSALKRAWDALLARRVLPRFRHVVALTPRRGRAGAWAVGGSWPAPGRGRVSVVPNGVDPTEMSRRTIRAPCGAPSARTRRRRPGGAVHGPPAPAQAPRAARRSVR